MDAKSDAQAILDQAIALSGQRRDGDRKAGDLTASGKLDALFVEIAAAILPREIKVEIADTSCSIIANSGRLVRTNLGGDQIHHQDPREVRLGRVAKLIQQFVLTEGAMNVWARPLADVPDDVEIGLSHSELREYCRDAGLVEHAADLDDEPIVDDGRSFEDALADAAQTSALISAGSGVAVISGDPTDLAPEDALRAMTAQLTQLPDGHPLAAGAWIIGHRSDDRDQIAGMVVEKESATFHAGSRDELPKLVRKWTAGIVERG